MATNTQVKYTIIDYKGQKARQYQDGSIRDNNGRSLALPPKLKEHAITSENASDYVRLRQEKYRQAAADAVMREIGAIAPNVHTPEAAYGELNGRLAVQIWDSDKPRGKDLEILGRNMGALGGNDDQPSGSDSTDDTARQLLLEIARVAGNAIGHVVDNYTYLNHETVDVVDVEPVSVERDDSKPGSADVDAESDEK